MKIRTVIDIALACACGCCAYHWWIWKNTAKAQKRYMRDKGIYASEECDEMLRGYAIGEALRAVYRHK